MGVLHGASTHLLPTTCPCFFASLCQPERRMMGESSGASPPCSTRPVSIPTPEMKKEGKRGGGGRKSPKNTRENVLVPLSSDLSFYVVPGCKV